MHKIAKVGFTTKWQLAPVYKSFHGKAVASPSKKKPAKKAGLRVCTKRREELLSHAPATRGGVTAFAKSAMESQHIGDAATRGEGLHQYRASRG